MTESTPSATSVIAPVRQSVTVPLDVERAFELWVARFDTWWPPEHKTGDEAMESAIIEPHEGGRVYEVGVNGAECDWGRVVTYEPPNRLVVAWQLNGRWQFDPDIDKASEYEVTFDEQPGGNTLVTLVHRNFERHGPDGVGIAAAVAGPDGWPGLIELYAAAAA